ncbi:hypothetical protein V6O07_14940, partial [Arthrospira platensis SPKY2]
MLLSAAMLGGVIWLSRHAERAVPEGSRAAKVALAAEPRTDVITQALAGFGTVLRSKYLLRIALFVLLLNLVNTNGLYILATFLTGHAQQAVGDSGGTLTTGLVISRFYG